MTRVAEPFLVVGAMKSGTTTLDALLRAHPDVDVVAEKESSALLRPETAASFAERVRSSRLTVAGEVTAGYLQAPVLEQPVELAVALLGDRVRVLAVVRDPFDRAVSHWQHLRQLGREPLPLREAILDPAGPYLAFSSYHRQLEPWVSTFGRDQVLVFRLEDYRAAPAAVAGRIWDFLGVPSRGALDARAVHANPASQRVVATGWKARVRSTTFYRRVLRPLLPPAARRGIVSGLGGSRGREEADVDASLRTEFEGLLASDAQALEQDWPELVWVS